MKANNMMNQTIPLLGISALSGTGKTTLLAKLIPILCAKGINVALIKHTHHDVDVDKPGKDSYVLRKSGAQQTMVVCDQRWALMSETPEKPASLWECSQQFDPRKTDIILVEGFKGEPIPKILLYRQAIEADIKALVDENTLAIASDTPLNLAVPCLDLNDIEAIALFITDFLMTKEA